MEIEVNPEPPKMERGGRMLSPQVQAGVRQLGIDPSNERFMMLVDDMMRSESLPRGWTATFNAEEGRWVWTDKNGRQYDKHPVHDYYIGAMFMDRGGYAKLKQLAAERPPTADEIKQMGLYLNIKEGEDPYLWQVAEMALSAPLPPEWDEVLEGSPEAPQVLFKNKQTGDVIQEHPLDNYFRELLRRRRKELVRRKKAALKALQAVVRMGGARRSLFANLVAKNKAAGGETAAAAQPESNEQEQEDLELEAMDPAVQSSLQTAWQGLLGSATTMVKSLQAAKWPGSSKHKHRKAAAAAEAANQQRLQQLCDQLTTALDPNVAAGTDAAVTLQEIEQLAAQAKAASSDPDKIAQVLSDQGIVITIGDADEGERRLQPSSSASHRGDASHNLSRRYSRNESSKSAARSEPSLSGVQPDQLDPVGDGGAAAAAVGGGGGGEGSLLQQANMTLLRPGQDSSINNKVSFLRVSTAGPDAGQGGRLSTLHPTYGLSPAGNSGSGAYANIGPYSSSGGGYDWSLSGGIPSPASSATAQKIRAYAALARQTQDEAIIKTAVEAVAADKAQLDPDRDPDHAARPVQGSFMQGKALDPNGQRSQSYGVQTGGAQTADSAAEPGPQQQTRLGFFLDIGGLPPPAQVALQYISMLQAVVEEATSLIKSRQQQGLLIVLLQQLLATAAAELEDGQARFFKVLIELDQIKHVQQQQTDAAAAASADHLILLQQLEQANTDLQKSMLDSQQTQLGCDGMQKSLEAALAAAAAAGVQQQQLEMQLATAKQQLQQEQEARQQQVQRLIETRAELEMLRAGHAQLAESSGTEVATAASQLSQLQSEYQILKQKHANLQQSLAQGQSAAAAAGDQQQELAQQLQQTQQELVALKGAYAELLDQHAQLQTRFNQQGQELASSEAKYSALQGDHQQQLSELSTARELIQRLRLQHEQSGGDLGSAQTEVAALQAELENVKQHEKQLEQHGQQLQQERDGLQHQQQQLQQEKLHLQDKVSESSKQLADLLQQLAAAQQQLQQLEQEKQQLQAQLTGGSEGMAIASQQLAEMQQQLQLVTHEQQLLQAQLSGSNKELDSVSQQLTETQQQSQLLEQEKQQLRKQLGDSSNELARRSEQLAQTQQQSQLLEQEKQQLQQRLDDSNKELATNSQQLAQTQQRSQLLEQEKQQLQQQLDDTNKELLSASQQLVQTQQQLQQERQQLQGLVDGRSKDLASVSQQLAQAQQQSQLLEQVKQQLQAQVSRKDKQLADVTEQLQETLQQLHQTQQQLVHTQQQHQELQQHHQQSQQQVQQLQAQNKKALEDQIKLMDVNSDLVKQIKDLKAAAEAAEKQRLSKPSKVCQITAADADQQHWTKARSVQTGEELDPRSKRDVGTPADLSLLSYFFRDIKQKQRGGGGAIIGYDPDSAREAAAAAASPPTSPGKSWTGGSLPGIQVEAKRAASMPGTIRSPVKQSMPGAKKLPEEEVQDGNLDLRPVPFEVKNRVDRRRDREMKLEREARGAGDRWDYAADERDTEIAELKKRLVEQDRKHKEMASKTAEDVKIMTVELQGFKHSTELLQTDNFTLRKKLTSMRSAMQAVGMPVPGSPDTSSGGARQSLFGPRASVMFGQQGTPGRTSVFALGSPGRTSVFAKDSASLNNNGDAGRPKTTGSSESGHISSVSGARLSMAGAGSVPLPGSHPWGSGIGSLGSGNPGILAGGVSVSGSGGSNTPLSPKTEKGVQFLSLSGAAGVQFPGVVDQGSAKGSLSPRAQQLVPTLRSGTGNAG